MQSLDWSNPTVQVAALGIAGVILASLLAGIFGTLSALAAGHQSSSADTAARAETRQDRLDEIQRTTLLEIQERLTEWMRAETKVYMADLATLKEHGRVFLLPDDVSQESFMTGRRLMYLTDRVRDDALRESLIALRSDAARIEVTTHIDTVTIESLKLNYSELFDDFRSVQSQLGLVLRTYL